MATDKYESVDAYIESFPATQQQLLTDVRNAAFKAVPGALEAIKYNMPSVLLNGKILVCYGAYKTHIGLYPVPADDHEDFAKDLAKYYTSGKGTIQFPLDKAIPKTLVGRIVKWNMQRQKTTHVQKTNNKPKLKK